MKKPFRLIFWTLGGGVILFALFILAVNLYVQSEGMKRKIQRQLGALTGLPVHIFRTSYMPWSGFRLSQLECRQPGPAGQESFLLADNLDLHPDWLPLLTGRLVINHLDLNHPLLTLQEDAAGALLWPVKAVAGTESGQKSPQSPSSASARPGKAARIQKILLSDATLRIVNRQGNETLRLENVRLAIERSGSGTDFTGKLSIPRILIQNALEITACSSPVNLTGGRLALRKIEATCAKGRINGSLELQPNATDLPYSLDLRLSRLNLASLFQSDPDWADQISGQLSGDLQLDGLAGKSRSNHGSAKCKISGGEFRQSPMLQVLGSILHSDELTDLKLQQAEAQLQVLDSAIRLQPLELISQNLRLTATGEINAEHRLDLACALQVNENTFKRLPSEARENFQPVADSKDRVLTFQVDGLLSQPRTDFMTRLVGDRLERKMRNFFGFFGGKKSDPASSPTSSPTPVPHP